MLPFLHKHWEILLLIGAPVVLTGAMAAGVIILAGQIIDTILRCEK